MQDGSDPTADETRRLGFIRDETRFEIGVLHDRINALISAEAFLTIAFTMAMGNANAHVGASFFGVVAPILSLVGLTLALLAWPGVDTSFNVILEWNACLLRLLDAHPGLRDTMWRPGARSGVDRRADLDRRSSLLFARSVPLVFAVAWTLLTIVALALSSRA